jgi:uncharacterized protein YdeI (YjbR/CyaY-like superfamily)
LSIVESGVNSQARRFNDLKISNERLTKELKQRLDELNTEKANFEALNSMKKVTYSSVASSMLRLSGTLFD